MRVSHAITERRETSLEDPDAATIGSLSRLAGGDPARFARHTQPPESIQSWIDRLDLEGVNALLIHTLRRWHKLGGDR